VFEIGSSLREARVRQRLGIPEIERGTKIRAKYLKALEDEQFDVLPGETYVKGFLRTYAEFLGLDGQLYVDEFNSRYATIEEEMPQVRRTSITQRRRVGFRPVLVVLGVIAALTALVIAAWKSGSNGGSALPNVPVQKKKNHKPRHHRHTKPVAPKRANLILVANHGRSWVEAHAGSQAGKRLFYQTLELGQMKGFWGYPRLWLNVGQPASLTWKLNGKIRPTPSTAAGTFVVTPKGISAVSHP
jgi:hypothetical protein